MHWENVAAGKISSETPSPRMLFEDSLALTKVETELSPDNKITGQNDIVEKITKLKTLCEAGLISQEEFEVKKKELLDNF